MADHWTSKIEPEAHDTNTQDVAAISTAISLKRIADALEVLVKKRVPVALSADDLHEMTARRR